MCEAVLEWGGLLGEGADNLGGDVEEEDGGNEGEGEDEDDEWVTRKSVSNRRLSEVD